MDFNTTIDIIIKDLHESREIIEDLKNFPGAPRLQIELAKSKIKSAADVIELLKTLKTEVEVKPAEVKAAPVSETAAPAETKEILIEIGEEEVIDEIPPQPVEENEIRMEKQPEPKKKDSSIIADRFSDMPNTLHESFGKINEIEDISSVIKSKPVQNLTDAIGINDKFLFIREIFGGNHSNYDEALLKLNKAESIADAKAIIMSYTGEGDENEAIVHLMSLVKRKLASDG